MPPKLKGLLLVKELYIIALFLFLSLFVTFVWYRGVDFIGGGEEGISLWRPFKSFTLASNVWIDVGSGYPSSFFLPRTTLFLTAYFLDIFFTRRITQLLIFLILIFSSLIGVYLLSVNIFRLKKQQAIIASLFYFFNLYTLSQVFSRFIFAGIYAWAFIPILVYLGFSIIKRFKINYLVFFVIVNIFASTIYSHPAYILVLWIFLGLCLFKVLLKGSDKRIYLINFLSLFCVWLATNIWWVYPMLSMSNTVGVNPSVRGWEYDFAVLQGLSRDFTNLDILFLKHKYFFERSGYWQGFYKNSLPQLVSFLIFVFVLIGLFTRKVKNKLLLSLLFILGWFLVKGTNPPLGSTFYKFLFEKISFFSIFRNSYEKLGIIFLLPYSILFSIGIHTFISILDRSKKNVVLIFLSLIIFIYLMWPVWTGNVFSDLAYVSIPASYRDANTYLNTLSNNYRILSLPFIPGEGVHYTWAGGNYYGLEPSEFVFDRPVISWKIPNINTIPILESLDATLRSGKIDYKILDDLAIGYIILHKDIDTKYSNAPDINSQLELLSDKENFKLEVVFGDLSIYSVMNRSKIITAKNDCDDEYGLDFKKVSSSKFVVSVSNMDCSYNLIFRTTFDNRWKAYIDSKLITNHEKVLGYANSWRVVQTGNHSVVLTFNVWPWE